MGNLIPSYDDRKMIAGRISFTFWTKKTLSKILHIRSKFHISPRSQVFCHFLRKSEQILEFFFVFTGSIMLKFFSMLNKALKKIVFNFIKTLSKTIVEGNRDEQFDFLSEP